MSLKTQILEDIKTTMKEKNQVKLDTLRFLQSAVKRGRDPGRTPVGAIDAGERHTGVRERGGPPWHVLHCDHPGAAKFAQRQRGVNNSLSH